MIYIRKQEGLCQNKVNSSFVSIYNYKMVYSYTVRANWVVVLKHVISHYSSKMPWIHLTLRILGNSPGTWRNRRDVAHGHRPSDLVPPWLLQSSDGSCGLCWPEIQAQNWLSHKIYYLSYFFSVFEHKRGIKGSKTSFIVYKHSISSWNPFHVIALEILSHDLYCGSHHKTSW